MTTRQRIPAAISAYRRQHGHPPDATELADAMGLHPSTIGYHLAKLPAVKASLRTKKDRV